MKQARKNKVEKSSFIEYDEQLLEESDSIETIIEWAYQNFEKWLPSKRDDKNIKVLIQLTWEQET